MVAAVLAILVIVIGFAACNASKEQSKIDHDHYWQKTVEEALDYYKVDRSFTDCVLAMIQVESSGDVDVDDYHDICQAREGDGGKILLRGVRKQGVEGSTPQASIYAGVYELKACIKDFKKYLGYSPDPTNLNDLALLTQGYNYGHYGWFSWLARNNITEWTLENSQTYQQVIDGLGTATHGGKVQEAYKRITQEEQE